MREKKVGAILVQDDEGSAVEQPRRRSEGAVALFQRIIDGQRQYLAQWNEKWRAFFFIGGHREESETFRECVVREIEEELELPASECRVATEPAHHLEYQARSQSANELTAYVMELFDAQLTAWSLERVERNSQNRWLSQAEIQNLETEDARAVSPTMLLLLSMAGRIS
jgi:8-oxo-dGTP pyrophosphatase MutT (NUDIX family)